MTREHISKRHLLFLLLLLLRIGEERVTESASVGMKNHTPFFFLLLFFLVGFTVTNRAYSRDISNADLYSTKIDTVNGCLDYIGGCWMVKVGWIITDEKRKSHSRIIICVIASSFFFFFFLLMEFEMMYRPPFGPPFRHSTSDGPFGRLFFFHFQNSGLVQSSRTQMCVMAHTKTEGR